MWCLLSIINLLFMTVMVLGEKYDALPYEFGFTIDGQQHRHEKKDINGIIQGEFGFITADGIYHVTVYATDENGNFRILSMKNIRISDPLDGSAPSKQPQRTPKQSLIQPHDPVTPQNTVVEITTKRLSRPYVFTTLSTIKTACASCGIVTTPKPKQKQLFPFQTPKFQDDPVENSRRQKPNYPSPQNFDYNNYPNRYSNYPGEPSRNPDSPSYPGQDNNPNNPNQENNYHNQNFNYPTQGSVPNYPNKDPAPFQRQTPDIPEVITQNQIKPLTRTTLSQVSVTNGVIHVPGNADIPIQDKYPGMIDGLPNGINDKDITDLLYKFNYTVGFHGHYEKGYKNGAKVGGYFVNGRDGVSRVVTYIADENGFRPKFKFIRLGLDSTDTPKKDTEKTFGLKNFEFIWYPTS